MFGAKAADTSRGRNIAKLIKDGRDTAEITVFIKNHAGPMSYKHEVYGEEIELTRKFKRNGKDGATATYLMRGRGDDGRVNSSKASSDVRAMCDAFNIQVANPCVVMTQEVAKKFLQSKNPEDKYMFFLKATQLESLREKLHDARGRIDAMRTTLKVQQDKIPDLDKRIAHLLHQEKLAEEAEQMGTREGIEERVRACVCVCRLHRAPSPSCCCCCLFSLLLSPLRSSLARQSATSPTCSTAWSGAR